MIPLLFAANAADYDADAKTLLSDATSCSVTEELNGAYQLKMTLPRTSKNLEQIAVGKQILAAANPFDRAQPFRITSLSKRLTGGVEITAPHLAYDLRRNPVNISGTYTSFSSVLAAIEAGQLASENLFSFSYTGSTDPTASPGMKIEGPAYIWDLLGSGDNTLLGCFYVDLKFDRREVIFSARAGSTIIAGHHDKYRIVYGANMTDFVYEADGDDMYSAVLPLWKSGSTTVVGDVQLVKTWGTTGTPEGGGSSRPVDIHTPNSERVMILDLSDKFSSKPSVSDLNYEASQFAIGKGANTPEIRMKVTAVPPGSRGLQALEEVQLGDLIDILHQGWDFHVKARVVQTVYDVLRDRYTSFDVEGRVYGVATTIAKVAKQVKTGRVAY